MDVNVIANALFTALNSLILLGTVSSLVQAHADFGPNAEDQCHEVLMTIVDGGCQHMAGNVIAVVDTTREATGSEPAGASKRQPITIDSDEDDTQFLSLIHI